MSVQVAGSNRMPDRRRPTRVLFVLSRDHGELFNAAYFAAGSAMDAVLAMPHALYRLNGDTLPYPSHSYRQASDLHTLLLSEEPDVVLFFSGYLYVINKLLQTEASVARLLEAVRGAGGVCATSDPSLGIMSTASPESFNSRHPRHAWLAQHFARMGDLLHDVPHLYLAPRGANPQAPAQAYFNPRAILSSADRQNVQHRLQARDGMLADRERWLFVLSNEDHAVQSRIHGQAGFTSLLAARLHDAHAAGRQPVVIAPPACLEHLAPAVRGLESLVAGSACSYPDFMDLLHGAEYVFYWNLFSASILARAINRQPFFVFDKGHLAYVLKPLLATAMAHFYPCCEPQSLDFAGALDRGLLEELAADQRARILPAIEDNLRGGHDPDDVVDRLLKTVAPR